MLYAYIYFDPESPEGSWATEIDPATHKRILQNDVSDIVELIETAGISWSEVERVELASPRGIFYTRS